MAPASIWTGSEVFSVAGKQYTITDETKAAEIAVMQELINELQNLRVTR